MSPEPYGAGQEVELVADPSVVGLVQTATRYDGGWTYRVFFSATDIQQLTGANLRPHVRPELAAVVSRAEFLRDLVLTKLRHPINDLFYTFRASRTTFEAYQFKPVLKFLSSPVPAILIADEVGLGKTIEAAILMQELKARQALRRVLIICPAGLREKWQAELLNRFDEQFTIVRQADVQKDAVQFRATTGNNPFRGIVSLESFRATPVQEALTGNGVTYDMTIIDEAHHLRTSGTLSNEMGERIREISEHLVLLTATPLQTSQQDLFNLLQLIDPALFTSYEDFLLQLEPNGCLNEAIRALRDAPPRVPDARAALQAIGGMQAADQVLRHPTYPLVRKAIERDELDHAARVRLVRDLDAMNVLSPVYTRTKKSSVSSSAQRKAFVIPVTPTDEEAGFLELVLELAREETMRRTGARTTPGFVGMMRERQAASCISAMRAYLRETTGHAMPAADVPALDAEAAWVNGESPVGDRHDTGYAADRLLAEIDRVGPVDTKLATFLRTLGEVLAESPDTKVIVFTFFRRTLQHLEESLRNAGIVTLSIHGSVKPEQRALGVARFREGDPTTDRSAPRVMLTTEVGSEGLDFQFCDTLFNYDLPWNPMRIEQRIGRIDRYGQKSPQVRIYSFYMAGTIEERILVRLYARIGVFEQSVGDLEPILGPIAQELTREVFTRRLTPAEEEELADRLAMMAVNRRAEEKDLEEKSAALLGQDALLRQAVEDNVRAGRFVSPAELRALVGAYLDAELGIALQGDLDAPTVLIPQSGRLAAIVENHAARRGDSRPVTTRFLERARSSHGIAGTFDADRALSAPNLEFFNVRHPLVELAREHFPAVVDAAPPLVRLGVPARTLTDRLGITVAPGAYRFSIHLLESRGGIREIRIVPIVLDAAGARRPDLEGSLLRIVQELARDRDDGIVPLSDRARLEEESGGQIAALTDDVRIEASERNDAVIAVRRATLERTYGHRLAKRRAMLAAATDRRIIGMRTREIANLEDELERRLNELERSRTVSVGSRCVGYGSLDIETDRVSPPREPVATNTPAPSTTARTIMERWRHHGQ